LVGADAALQAAIASDPTHTNIAPKRPIDMQYHRPRIAHTQVEPMQIRMFGLV